MWEWPSLMANYVLFLIKLQQEQTLGGGSSSSASASKENRVSSLNTSLLLNTSFWGLSPAVVFPNFVKSAPVTSRILHFAKTKCISRKQILWLLLSEETDQIKSTKVHLLCPKRSSESPSFHFFVAARHPNEGQQNKALIFLCLLPQKVIFTTVFFLPPANLSTFLDYGVALPEQSNCRSN